MPTKCVLVVEDDPSISNVIQTCLRKLGGWNVVSALSGNEGLLKAETEQPDAILLDVMMPDMDGLTLLQHLREKPATQAIPVILLTAKVLSTNHFNYAQLDLAGVIPKPFDPLKLSGQIAELLGWSSQD